MQRQSHSFQAARTFLRFALLVLGGAAIGNALRPGSGAAIGSCAGGAAVVALLVRDARIRRRGDAWVRAGRDLGLRSVYSGHVPALPFPGMEEPGNLLAGNVPGGTLYVGDRTERLLIEPRPVGDEPHAVLGGDPEVSDPVMVETFVVLHLPGTEFPASVAGRSRSLLGRADASHLAECGLGGIAGWLERRRDWRVELAGEFVMASRPRRICPIKHLPRMVHDAQTLLGSLPDSAPQGTAGPLETSP